MAAENMATESITAESVRAQDIGTGAPNADRHSYFHIIKSMAMIGGSSVVNVLFSIIRNKALAVLLGPAGVGQMGLYMSIVDLTQALAGFGVQSSGVRQIAEATGTGDTDRIARTATALRRTSIVLGLIGAVLLAALASPIASLTFGDDQHTLGVALLSFAILLQLMAGGQIALTQGMRDIASLARIQILSGLATTCITITLVMLFGPAAIAPAIVASAAALLAICWWFSKRLRISRPSMSTGELAQEVAPLLKLGFAFMLSAFLGFGASYVVRLLVTWEGGVGAAGQYQAAWALGGLYAGFILQAMGADFYPRLTAAATDHVAANRLVNEQTQISLLLAGPGVLATLTFAPLAMWLFYSPEFHPAANILRWICLGILLRIVSWPLGYVIIAKGRQMIFFFSEVASHGIHVALAWLLVPRIGPIGAGVAFFGLYIWHGCMVYAIARRLTGFSWSPANLRIGLLFVAAAALVFGATQFLPIWQAMATGTLVTLVLGLYALRCLFGLLPPESLPAPVRQLMSKLA